MYDICHLSISHRHSGQRGLSNTPKRLQVLAILRFPSSATRHVAVSGIAERQSMCLPLPAAPRTCHRIGEVKIRAMDANAAGCVLCVSLQLGMSRDKVVSFERSLKVGRILLSRSSIKNRTLRYKCM